jgi:hypothetical protein
MNGRNEVKMRTIGGYGGEGCGGGRNSSYIITSYCHGTLLDIMCLTEVIDEEYNGKNAC